MRKPQNSVFVLYDDDQGDAHIELDVDMQRRPLLNPFLLDGRHETSFGKSVYEYRIEQTVAFYRLIEDEQEDMGGAYQDILDGVVQESAIRERYHWPDVDQKILGLKRQTEWQELVSWAFHSVKYFIFLKKLPEPSARRYLRQELERLKLGTSAFFKEAQKYGLEQDENWANRFRVKAGESKPSEQHLKALFESAHSFGITEMEFSWGKTLPMRLEKLLCD
jgi:hypothetical protein